MEKGISINPGGYSDIPKIKSKQTNKPQFQSKLELTIIPTPCEN